jgi:hypothetical protein
LSQSSNFATEISQILIGKSEVKDGSIQATGNSVFGTKKGIKEPVRGDKGIFIRPAFYKVRMKEAKRIVSALRKAN